VNLQNGFMNTLLSGVLLLTVPLTTIVAPTEPETPVRIAAVGDSNTFGSGAGDLQATRSYPAQLQEQLGERYEIGNFGHSGATLLSTGALPYAEQEEYNSSLEFQPDIILIMLGTNDAAMPELDAERFEAELTELIVSYRELQSRPDVFLLTPPTAYLPQEEKIIQTVIPSLLAVARSQNVPVIDIHAATAGQSELFPDGLHPNAEGYGLIARHIAVSLRSEEVSALPRKSEPLETTGFHKSAHPLL
jgi:acyl-CoA thioesterase I